MADDSFVHELGDSMRSLEDLGDRPSVLTSKEAARVLRVGVREVRLLVDSGLRRDARDLVDERTRLQRAPGGPESTATV